MCTLPIFLPSTVVFPERVSALELPTQNVRISVQISRQQTMTLKSEGEAKGRARGARDREAKTTSCNFLFYIFNGILSNAINRNCSFTHAYTHTHRQHTYGAVSKKHSLSLYFFLSHTHTHTLTPQCARTLKRYSATRISYHSTGTLTF